MKCRERFMSEVRSLALVTCAVSAALAVPAWGQDGPAAGSGDEIIVTANKRSQNLQDVGLSVSAISGDALKNQQISNLADVAQIVPGLTFLQTANDTPVYTLRGVGFFESTLAAYPDVIVYLDQVPIPFPTLTSLTAFELDRLEVIKGSQGTLLGQSSKRSEEHTSEIQSLRIHTNTHN